jgi:hypothetical protein
MDDKRDEQEEKKVLYQNQKKKRGFANSPTHLGAPSCNTKEILVPN